MKTNQKKKPPCTDYCRNGLALCQHGLSAAEWGTFLYSAVEDTWLLSTPAHLSSSSLAYAVLKTCWTCSEITSLTNNNTVPILRFFRSVTEGSGDQVCQVKVAQQSNGGASPNFRTKADGLGSFCPRVHILWLALIIRPWHFSLNCGNDFFFPYVNRKTSSEW